MRLILAVSAAFALLTSVASAQVAPIITQTDVACGTSSTALLSKNAAAHFIFVQAPSTAGVWINWTGVAAVAAPPSEHVVASAVKLWSPVVPQQASTCISDGGSAVTVTVEYW